MDAGKWAEAEPGQDGGTEGGHPHSRWFAAKSGVRSLGIHLDLMLTMETQVVSVVRTTFFHLWQIAQL